ncbi:hypothetical protein F4780DRAFT_650155 [Xylariomycetidae sp. FL0641]|nr:hypothetical protein F4780DRAFT_650155 [Xylariomycetidae sp. FL0641]
MAGDPPPPPRGGGLSLYANLLEPEGGSAPGSISRGPVVSQEAIDAAREQEAAKKPLDSALRFQPYQQIRRPQPKVQKPKGSFPKAPLAVAAPPPPSTDNVGGGAAAAAAAAATAAPAKSTLADWAATEDDEYMYGTGEKRARGGRKKKKKKFETAPVETDWDEIYDPARPTNVDEYLRSDERIREVQEWKALLYRHRRRDQDRQDSWDSEEEQDRPMNINQFAPPDSYSFAPPPPSPPQASVPDDKTGDDAYARRLALSQGQAPPPPPPQAASQQPPPPPPPAEPDTSTIAREPVRYTQPEPPAPDADAMDQDEYDYVPPEASSTAGDDEPQARSNRPGQKGFAARLMSKYGWEKGQGLGADSGGILQPLKVQIEKRKKRSDAEGGGWAEPGGKGRIIGSKTGAGGDSDRGTGLSNVIVLRGMLENLPDLQTEVESGLGQEIGEECGDQYGRVERLHIDVPGRRVYIKFTDQVSALRAVNALDGRIFNGNTIQPQFYDVDKFERRVYE